jgi:hypothetical protein
MKQITQAALKLAIIIIWVGCASKQDSKTTDAVEQPAFEPEKTSVSKAPIVNIEDTIAIAQTVLCMKDTASTEEGMRTKLINIYSKKLLPHFEKNKLKPMGQHAWITQEKNMYAFEAGIALEKSTQSVGKGMFLKNIAEDSAYVAHFWGPQNLKSQGYAALKEIMTENKKEAAGTAFETFGFNFDSTSIGADAYKQETIITMPYKRMKIKKEKEQSLLKTSKEIRKEVREGKRKK